jgi:hypothetical protein
MTTHILKTLLVLSSSALALGCIEDNPDFMGASSSLGSDTSGGTAATSAEDGGVDAGGTSGTADGETTGDGDGGMTGNPGTASAGSGNSGGMDTTGAEDTTGTEDTTGGGETSTTGVMCDPGLTDCGGECVDLQSTKQHCGECFNSCMGNMDCDMGMCVPK